jgi:Fe-S-cluster containining protein
MNYEQASRSVLILPEKPDIAARRKAIREMAETSGITALEATLLYEYNNAEPIILAKQDGGECCFLRENLCSKYLIRPYSCGLYLCNMGEKLSYIQEMIIRQGTWHAYYRLGWISAEEIAHNPFLKADSYDKLLLADFDFKLENTLAQLFFYF